MDKNRPTFSCANVTKSFQTGDSVIHVLRGVELTLKGENSIAIVGASGCGKSTFLHLLAGLEKPTSGEIEIQGTPLSSLRQRELDVIRNRTLGFVYQLNHLLPEFTAEENVAMPLLIRRVKMDEALRQARTVVNKAGLGHRFSHKPAQMSGGERQRTAIARAVVGSPACVLADEPTGNLDNENSTIIIKLLDDLRKNFGISFVIATHDSQVTKISDKLFYINNGQLNKERII